MNLLIFLYTFLGSICGSMVQAITGFGFGVVVAMIFPLYMPILDAAALSGAISLILNGQLAWHYRHSSEWKKVLFPALCYSLVTTAMVLIVPSMDVRLLSMIYAVTMVVIALYMLFFSQRMKVRPTQLTGAVCSSIAGAGNGLFAVGGPPMTLYYMSVFGANKLAYLGTLQLFFFLTGIVANATRLTSGLLTPSVLWLVIPGFFGQALGAFLGTKITNRIPAQKFSTVVYLFLIFSGVLTLVNNLY